MENKFEYLFSPLTIGAIQVPNRIVMTGMATFFGEKGLATGRHADYFEARAKGGAGLIISEGVVPHPSGDAIDPALRGYEEKCIPGYKKIVDAVHRHGAKVICQICHPGRQSNSSVSRQPLWAPSAIPCATSRETPHAMEMEEIRDIIQGFVISSQHAQAAGYDGVEIHGSHGYLIQQFMSPFSNRRTDEYGGSVDNRLRFFTEILEGVRKAVGRDFVIGVRIPGDELVPGGLTLSDMQEIAPKLEATGNIDYISVSLGNYSVIWTAIPPMYIPVGFNVSSAAGIKEAVTQIPVFAAGRINDPVLAEKVLANGQADMVAMSRALLADPDMPAKARQGRLDDIRTCIACNEGCAGRVFKSFTMSCLQNPALGRERDMALTPAAHKKKVLVAGGGPAGLKAAETAALRGHDVILYEKGPELGGQVNIAARVPSRNEFGGCVRYLSKQMAKLGVKVQLNTEVTEQLIKSENPDAVVIATGSTPLLPLLPGIEQENVLTVWDVLLGSAEVGEKVILVDGGQAHWQCSGTAEYLAEEGKKVEIVTRSPFVGAEHVSTFELPLLYMKLFSLGVVFTPNTALKEISGKKVTVMNAYTKEERIIEGVDTIVLATGNQADDGLFRNLKSQVKELYGAGDCLAPRKAIDAIYEGFKVGLGI